MLKKMLENLGDKLWRINNLYMIVDKNSKLIKFSRNKIQTLLNENLNPNKLVLKSRQQGITTDVNIDQLDFTMFNRNVTSCIIAHDQDSIEKIFSRVKQIYKRLPDILKPKLDRGGGSKYEMIFPEIGSKIYCDLESRGDTINYLHVSEAAFVEESRLKATLEAVPIGSKITMETTPNGQDNHFYQRWIDQNSPYAKIFFPWFFTDEYAIDTEKLIYTDDEKDFIKKTKKLYKISITDAQIAFRRRKISDLGYLYKQEYPEDDYSCFLHSGETVIKDVVMMQERLDRCKPVQDIINGILIFKERDPKKNYIVAADVAEGVGGDFSVGHVLCLEDKEDVAFFRGQISPYLFAWKLKEMCDLYTTNLKYPLLAPELNNHGHAVLLELHENIKYPNLYRTEDKFGWVTNSKTRALMIDTYLKAIIQDTVRFNSKETLIETRALVEDKGKIKAPEGKHDDCVIAAAIAVQILSERAKLADIYQNIDKKLLV